MTLGPHPSLPLPSRRSRAYRARQVQQRRAIRLVIPAVVARATARLASLGRRCDLIDARVAELAHRLDVRDGQGASRAFDA